MAELLFWGGIALILYAYFGFPMVLLLLGRLRGSLRQPLSSRLPDELAPSVTLVTAVYNEEAVIREKIENSLSLDYPRARLEILIVSDASTDATHAIIGEYRNRGVRLIVQEQREGKTAALNAACPLAQSEILVLSDANGMLKSNAIRQLVQHFTDPQVGCVSGALHYVAPGHSAAPQGESLFLRYSAWLKKLESRFGAVMGAFGGNFAFRRELFKPMNPMLHNDMEVPLQILRRGYKVVYEARAVCVEPAAPRVGIEFGRHARISARAFWGVMGWMRCFLRPLRPFLLFEFVSEKLLRWLSPFVVLVVLAASLFLQGPFYHILQFVELAFFCLAATGAVLYWVGKSQPMFSLPFYLAVGNLAVVWGFVKCLMGTQGPTWSVVRED